jgi:hypothetical protein
MVWHDNSNELKDSCNLSDSGIKKKLQQAINNHLQKLRKIRGFTLM